ncbi:MAG: WbqC family protein [Bacteroidota bacterium]
MKIGIMQPYFFPYIGYFQLISSVDKFLIYEHISFRKRSWITRNRILNKGNGDTEFITVPVKSASSFKKISEITIDEEKAWRKKILNSVYSNYNRAWHFDEVFPFFEHLFYMEAHNLHEFNALTTKKICDLLEISTTITYEHEDCLTLEESLPHMAEENGLEVKTQRIIELCKKEKADTYVNPPGGRELYDKQQFATHDVYLKFLVGDAVEYKQFNFEHEPYLSMIDVLMHNGITKTKEFVNSYHID